MTPPNPSTYRSVSVQLRDYLVEHGFVRVPWVAGQEPPCWIAPAGGVPAAGDSEGIQPVEVGPTLVIGIAPGPGIPTGALSGHFQRQVTDIYLRCAPSAIVEAEAWAAGLRSLINDRHNWQMSDLLVMRSDEHRALTLVSSDPAQGHTAVCAYRWLVRSRDLDAT